MRTSKKYYHLPQRSNISMTFMKQKQNTIKKEIFKEQKRLLEIKNMIAENKNQ